MSRVERTSGARPNPFFIDKTEKTRKYFRIRKLRSEDCFSSEKRHHLIKKILREFVSSAVKT
jgi:hypothetical protein